MYTYIVLMLPHLFKAKREKVVQVLCFITIMIMTSFSEIMQFRQAIMVAKMHSFHKTRK